MSNIATNELLEKFQKIEVDNSERINENELRFCQEEDRKYKEFLKTTDDYIKHLNSFPEIDYKNDYKAYFSYDFNKEKLKETAEKEKERALNQFISNIFNYFEKKYKITLNNNSVREKYKNNIYIEYQILIDEMFKQLGGLSFKAKAINELKNEFCNKCYIKYYYEDEVKKCFEIKNKKIIIKDFAHQESYSWSEGLSYEAKTNILTLLKIINLFEYKAIEPFYFTYLYRFYQKDSQDIYIKKETNADKISHMKVFKNGRVDLYFSKNEYVKEFEKEFLNQQLIKECL